MGRLLEANSKILTLGYAIYPSGMSAIHFLENMLGVPYQYTKLFESNVYYKKNRWTIYYVGEIFGVCQ